MCVAPAQARYRGVRQTFAGMQCRPEMHVWRAQLGMLRHQVPDWATAWAAEEGMPHAEAWRMRSAPSCPCAALHCIYHDEQAFQESVAC